MKKWIAIILAAFATQAAAQDIGYFTNQAGGKIVLNMAPCHQRDFPSGRIAYTSVPGGKTSTGCWTLTGQNVMVQWDDGDIYTYPINRMTVIEQSGVRM